MNNCVFTGRLAKDPELKATNSGTEVCNFTIAVDRRVKKGEEKKADFLDCTAWTGTGVFVNTYFKKGDGITVSGRMESRKYTDKDGKERKVWELVAEDVEFPFGKANHGKVEPAGDGFVELSEAPIGDLPF